MDLPSGWYVVLDSKEVSPLRPLGITRFGIPLVAWRQTDGQVILMSDACPHRRAKLSLGQIEAGQIVCPFHGFRFDGSGKCTWVPEIERDAPGICARTFKTSEKYGWIWMYWGDEASATAAPPWFEDISNVEYVNRISEIWPVHFSRSVENQLDYVHLPFVHKTSIGRFAQPKEKPENTLTDQRIKWSFRRSPTIYIEFVYPNLWLNRLSNGYFLTLAFSPIDESHTQLYLRSHRQVFTWPPLSWIVDFLDRRLNRWILGQDRRVVLSQGPESSVQERDVAERLVGSDLFIRHFRSWLKGRRDSLSS